MKLKTSFFDSAVLKKDLLRFWPAWGLYFIGILLLTQNNAGDAYRLARNLDIGAGLMIINAIYGALVAMLLFGDLFKARMCNALHALPVRREAWFVSHATAGILMSLVPNLVVALLLMPFSAQFWYVPLLWASQMILQYLFCFGTAVLAIYLTGNTFAAALVYGIFHFCALLAMWLVDQFYIPLLYGLKTNQDAFMRFSPIAYSLENYEAWEVEHLDSCTNPACKLGNHYDYHRGCQYKVTLNTDIWVYLAIMAAVGVAFLVAALLLYRKRKLESAGDFVSVKPMKTVFTVLMSLAAGILFYAIVGEEGPIGYIMLLLGGIVGFFVCQMLLMRTIKVFGGKSWIKLGALVAAVAISLGLTAVDVFGITRIVPDADDILSVTLADSHLSQYDFQRMDANSSSLGSSARGVDPNYLYGRIGYVTLTEPEQIQKAITIHELLLQEGDPQRDVHNGAYTPVTVHYRLKNGTTLTRYYYGDLIGDAVKKLHEFTNTPIYILGVESAEELLKNLRFVYYNDDNFYHEVAEAEWQQKLAEALWQDAQDGNLHQSFIGGNKAYVEFSYDLDGRYRYLNLMIPYAAENTQQWAGEYYAYLKESGKINE